MEKELSKGIKLLEEKRDSFVEQNKQNLIGGKKIQYQHFCNQIAGMSICIDMLKKIG